MELEKRSPGELTKAERGLGRVAALERSWSERVLDLVRAKNTQESWRLAALELGEAARLETDPAVFRNFEAELARVPVDSDWSRVYMLALTDVVSALVNRVEEELVDERAAQLARRFREYLPALSQGSRTQTQLAEMLEKDPGQVSRELTSLREAGLVEAFAVDDKRERPQRLTLRGRHALAEQQQRARTFNVFMRSIVVRTTRTVDVKITSALDEASRQAHAPDFLVRLTTKAPPAKTAIVIRSEVMSCWQNLLLASAFVTRWRECTYLTRAMIEGGFARIPDERFVVLYDDRKQAELDKVSEQGRKLLGTADQCFLVAPTSATKPTLALESLR